MSRRTVEHKVPFAFLNRASFFVRKVFILRFSRRELLIDQTKLEFEASWELQRYVELGHHYVLTELTEITNILED